ncbi:MAG: hypothetical protein ACOC1O_00425 [bacterium]
MEKIFNDNVTQWIDHLHNNYVNSQYIPELKVFKLDKVQTQIDPIYMEEKQSGRIYLKPFTIKGLHDDGKWQGILDVGVYGEQEPNLIIHLNFNDMVSKIRDLKNKEIAKLFISYTGDKTPYIEKKDQFFNLYEDKRKIISFDVTDSNYSTVTKLQTAINEVANFNAEFEGKNDISRNLVNFNKTSFYGNKIKIYSLDNTFENVTDVIEMGDAILTNKYRLYEVISAMPGGNFGWEYVTWKIECKLADITNFNLPENYITILRKNQDKYRTKVDVEGESNV